MAAMSSASPSSRSELVVVTAATWSLGLALCLLASGCAASAPAATSAPAAPPPPTETERAHDAHPPHPPQLAHPPWFDGSPEAAFELAAREQRKVLVYWGAAWCPPCNQLKSQVFSHPEFAPLLSGAIAIHIDGDADAAQRWASELRISGYPTLVLLEPDRHEVMRLDGAMTFDEFREAFEAAVDIGRPFEETVARALAGEADAADWRLIAHTSWWDADRLGFADTGGLIETVRGLVARVPKAMPRERAVLAGWLLGRTCGIAEQDAPDPKVAAALAALRPELSALVDSVLAEDDTIFAARETIAFEGPCVTRFVADGDAGVARTLERRWLAAAAVVGAHEHASLTARLYAKAMPLQLEAAERGDDRAAPISPASVAVARSAAAWADAAATTPRDRIAVIPYVSKILSLAGLDDEATKLLVRESQTSETPWYYFSTLAAQAEARKDTAAALAWSEKAMTTAEGPATRIQWHVMHVGTLCRLDPERAARELPVLLERIYAATFAVKDGFAGRNAQRLGQMAGVVASLSVRPEIAAVIAAYRPRCAEASGFEEICRAHFEAYTAASP